MKRCISIFGPTASGKSSLAIRLATAFNGVIISADSMQIYRHMNIGTAKPSRMEMDLVPHKLIDICDPTETFSVFDFKEAAKREINLALEENKLPILVGGTGLYLDSVFNNTDFGEMTVDPNVRSSLLERAAAGQGAKLLEELRAVDPESASPLHEKDLKRILRALEVYASTGKTLSEFKKESHKKSSEFSFLKFYLKFEDRQVLYDRINQRVDQMISQGLLEETKHLLSNGYFSSKTSSQAIGYKELLPHLLQGESLEHCVDRLKQKTRNYAKRQITWFGRYEDAIPIIMVTDCDPFARIQELTEKFLEEKVS